VLTVKVQSVHGGHAWATPRSVFKFSFLVHELLHVRPDFVQIKGAAIIIKFNNPFSSSVCKR
jgi:hypothetical protein